MRTLTATMHGALLAAFAATLGAQSQAPTGPSAERLAESVRIAIEAAVDRGDRSAIEASVILTERALGAFPNDAMLAHYRAYALYRAGSMALGANDKDRARRAFESARDILETLAGRQTIAESYALLASVYGMQIGVSRVPMVAGMQLGPRSSRWMVKALAEGPRNPRVRVMEGIGAFNTPSSFGGGLDKAEVAFKQALALFADDHPAAPLPAWGRADAHLWLGQVYAGQKKRDLARAQYDSALVLQPGNGWIAYVLIPALDKLK